MQLRDYTLIIDFNWLCNFAAEKPALMLGNKFAVVYWFGCAAQKVKIMHHLLKYENRIPAKSCDIYQLLLDWSSDNTLIEVENLQSHLQALNE